MHSRLRSGMQFFLPRSFLADGLVRVYRMPHELYVASGPLAPQHGKTALVSRGRAALTACAFFAQVRQPVAIQTLRLLGLNLRFHELSGASKILARRGFAF